MNNEQENEIEELKEPIKEGYFKEEPKEVFYSSNKKGLRFNSTMKLLKVDVDEYINFDSIISIKLNMFNKIDKITLSDGTIRSILNLNLSIDDLLK